MTPALWAVISFSIFIASMMQMSWPSSTVAPCSTRTFHMLPCSGDSSVSGPPAPPLLRSARLGLRAAGAAPLDAAAGAVAIASPWTTTSKRLPPTSTT